MLRRLTLEEPPSRLAIWSRRLVLFAYAVALLVLILVRGGIIETVPGMVALIGALSLATAGMLFALASFVVIWRDGNPGFGKAILAFFMGLVMLAYPTFIGLQGYRLPMIADIATDTQDPPRFQVAARLRPSGANPIQYPGGETAEKQRAAYPDLAPVRFANPPLEVYTAALEVVNSRKWAVVDARAPLAGRREGHIEAVARTLIMGLRDDIVIRVRAVQAGAILDIRSASRYGRHDFGDNARRIRSLVADIEEEIGSAGASQAPTR